ncbi:C45 family peptidase [Pseudorhodobacter sp.]|uniref:C45 family peptidase n=1 Tax=Pseudorhodobacter sp. TaxID=1934400 RepID=UPI00264A3209|nr:C45 family peptidase [Pseudorhodobacter sp.]MDN5788180.1 C45 family autoproteolytic acyltransferase/hydrolase [Pseudorhodobacter sp.]
MQLDFRGLTEGQPGAAWKKVFAHGWPGWREWFLSRGGDSGPQLDESQRALRRYMPEMESLWEQLVAEVDGDDVAARFLSFWTPPRYLVGCSQLVMADDDGPMLIRNYDLDPDLNESTMLHSAWRGRQVMGMVEGMAGLSDGMNDSGLAASLTFGGRPQSGRGFGIPLIMRYVLEMCRDVTDAREALRRIPCHMSYNVTVADRSGAFATVFLAPDRPTLVSDRPLATNHQLGVEWPHHGRVSRTREREKHLETMVAKGDLTIAAARDAFLRAPLFSTAYDKAFGTVFTAAYRPMSGEATLSWRDGPPVVWRIGAFEPKQVSVTYSASGSVVGPAINQAAAFNAVPVARDPATVPNLAAFFSELADCMAGRQNWASLGELWRRPAHTASNHGDMT